MENTRFPNEHNPHAQNYQTFNSKPDISWPLIRDLGEFCISEGCQEIIYQSALEARNFPDTYPFYHNQ